MDDPFFDKARPDPPRPLISTGGAAFISLAAVACAYLWFADRNPQLAKEIGGGLIFGVAVLLFVLKS